MPGVKIMQAASGFFCACAKIFNYKSLGAISSSFKISVTTPLLIPQVASVAEQLGVHVQQFSSTKKRCDHTTGGTVEGRNLRSL
jgi:hypothetical protein